MAKTSQCPTSDTCLSRSRLSLSGCCNDHLSTSKYTFAIDVAVDKDLISKPRCALHDAKPFHKLGFESVYDQINLSLRAARAYQRRLITSSYSTDQHNRRRTHTGGLSSNSLVVRLSSGPSRHPPRDRVLTGEQITPDGTVPQADIPRASSSRSHDARGTTIRGVGE
jgi:hypothetical protein